MCGVFACEFCCVGMVFILGRMRISCVSKAAHKMAAVLKAAITTRITSLQNVYVLRHALILCMWPTRA